LPSVRGVGVSPAATDRATASYHRDEKINIFSKKHSGTELPENENFPASTASQSAFQGKFRIVKQLKKSEEPIKTEDSTPNIEPARRPVLKKILMMRKAPTMYSLQVKHGLLAADKNEDIKKIHHCEMPPSIK
jgi:hypothetical protein